MKQEDKKLLLQDLCGRLPYGVVLECCEIVGEQLRSIDDKGLINNDYDVDEVKPFLFPLSSMTKEQYYEMMGYSSEDCLDHMEILKSLRECTDFTNWPLYEYRVIDWFHKNHFDYRGLIPKGLAEDATGRNIY